MASNIISAFIEARKELVLSKEDKLINSING
jgi:hypothetical protein